MDRVTTTDQAREALTGACKVLATSGAEYGTTGHVSLRDPQELRAFLLNPFGIYLGAVTPDSIVKVPVDDIPNAPEVNAAAGEIHGAIYRCRPDVMAIAHAHTRYGCIWSSLHIPLRPLTQDACAFFQDHVVIGRYSGVIDAADEAEHLANSLGNRKAAILANHGLLTAGPSLAAAVWWLIALEVTCQINLAADCHGGAIPIPDDTALATRQIVGSLVAAERHYSVLLSKVRGRHD